MYRMALMRFTAALAVMACILSTIAGGCHGASHTRCEMLRAGNLTMLRESLLNPSLVKAPACGETLKIGFMMSFDLEPLISDFVIYTAAVSQAVADLECSGILGDMSIELVPISCDCNAAVGTNSFLGLLLDHNISMILGPECSVAAKPVARIASYVNIPVFAFSAEAVELSDRSTYRTLFRLNPSGSLNADGWISLLQGLGLNRVSIVRESGREFDEFVRIFENTVRLSASADYDDDDGGNATEAISLQDSQTVNAADVNIASVLDDIVDANARVVVTQVYAKMARALLCEARSRGLTTCCGKNNSKLLFIWPSWFTPLSWLKVGDDEYDGMNCTMEQLLEAAVGSFLVRSSDVVDGKFRLPYTNYTPANNTADLQKRIARTVALHQRNNGSYERSGDVTFAGFGYDAVWTAGYALREYADTYRYNLASCTDVRRLISHVSYSSCLLDTDTSMQETHRENLVKCVYKVNFTGISGTVAYDSNSTETNRVEARGQVKNLNADMPECSIQNVTTLGGLVCNLRTVGTWVRKGGVSQPLVLDQASVVWGPTCVSTATPEECRSPTSQLFADEATVKCAGLETLAGEVGCDGAIAIVVIFPTILLSVLILVTAMINRRFREKYKEEYIRKSMSRLQQFGLKRNDMYDLLVPDQAWEVSRSLLEINRKLGEGAFGTVFGADYFKDTDEACTPVAVKTLREDSDGDEKTKFFLEIQLMKKFTHNNVVAMLGVCTGEDPLYMVMELMLHGDMRDFLLSHRHLAGAEHGPDSIDAERLTCMALDIAYGLQYLHGIDFIHRDIAARNCMVTTNFKVKIGDFGMARDVGASDYYRVKASALLPVRWMAVESLLDGVFTAPTDVWSFGVVLYEMTTFGSLPFGGMENGQVMALVRGGQRMDLPPGCPEELASLMHECWHESPDRRPHASDLAQLFSTQKKLVTPCLHVLKHQERNPPSLSRRATLNAISTGRIRPPIPLEAVRMSQSAPREGALRCASTPPTPLGSVNKTFLPAGDPLPHDDDGGGILSQQDPASLAANGYLSPAMQPDLGGAVQSSVHDDIVLRASSSALPQRD